MVFKIKTKYLLLVFLALLFTFNVTTVLAQPLSAADIDFIQKQIASSTWSEQQKKTRYYSTPINRLRT